MIRFLLVGGILFGALLPASPVLDPLMAREAVSLCRAVGLENVSLKAPGSSTARYTLSPGTFEERLGWRDAGGFFLVLSVAWLAVPVKGDRRSLLRFGGGMSGTLLLFMMLPALFLAAVSRETECFRHLLGHPYFLPGVGASGLFFATGRGLGLRTLKGWGGWGVMVVVIRLMGYEAGVLGLLLMMTVMPPSREDEIKGDQVPSGS